MCSSIPEQIDLVFSKFSSKIAIHAISEESISYSNLLSSIKSRTEEIIKENPINNTVIAIITDNTIASLINILGVIYSGKIALPLNKNLTVTEKEKILDHAGCGLLINKKNDFVKKEFKILSSNVLNKNFALLIYTSGTTSDPKGVSLTHENILNNCFNIIEYFDFNDNHVKSCFLPIYHLFGLISDTFTMLFIGGTVLLCPQFSIGTAHLIHKNILKYKVNSFSLVPLILEYFNQLELSLVNSDVRLVVSGSAPLSKASFDKFTTNNKNVKLIPGYGLSETTCYSAINPLDDVIPNSIGKPFNFNEFGVIDENENFLTSHESGEIVIKGENVFIAGYFNSNINCYMISDRSYFKTGDIGYYDENDYFYITGRIKNMIIRGADKLYIESVDLVLKSINTDKFDSIAVKFERNDEELLIVVYSDLINGKDIMKERVIRKIIKEQLGDKYLPNYIINLSEISRNDTKKPNYKQIRKLLNNYDY